MQRCTQCAAQAQCCLYQETLLVGFRVLLHFMGEMQKVPELKKIKRQSPKWFRVERVQQHAGRVLRDLQESLQFITWQCFLHARLHKPTKASVCVCAVKQICLCMFGAGMCSVSFFVCCLGDMTAAAGRFGLHISTDLHVSLPITQCAGSEIICLVMVYSSFRATFPSTHLE